MPGTKDSKMNNQTKLSIDDSVKYLINEYGLDNLTVKEICEHAGVSRTSFYYYYKNRDEAILGRFNYVDDYFITKVEPYLTSSDIYENLLFYANSYMKFILTFKISYSKHIYISQIKYSSEKVNSHKRPVYKILIDLFDKLESSNESLKNKDSNFLADSFMTVIRGITFNWLLSNGSFDLESRGEEIIKIFLDGIL